MNDLVKRLREGEDGLEYAAANEIEELEDRISALEAALGNAVDENENQATHIAELEAALEEIRPLVICANHSEARYPKARAALTGGKEKLTPKEALAELNREQKRLNLDD